MIRPNIFSLTQEQLNYLKKLLDEFKPQNICELGSGVSTQVFNEYLINSNNYKFISIEHDSNYKSNTYCELIMNTHYEIGEYNFDNVNIYKDLYNTLKNNKFDFVLIDGPFGWDNSQKFSRVQMLEFLDKDLLDDRGYFLIHDSERSNSKNTEDILKQLFAEKGYKITKKDDNRKSKRLTIIYFEKNKEL